MLGGCVQSGEAPVGRTLPPLPAFARPSIVAEPSAGDPAIVVAARERAGRVEANRTVTGMARWYESVRDRYAGAQQP